ncbi:alpha-L-arabinofuranosidase C-terminal domain-containing protein [Arcicella rigui]|uniref:non-reducing end alpha-L-arabinofuranosidase n=1 Tax=Arcicella rigui TaxID=797020 RepID=A0ABU5QAQ1_9BACT|nr:alpha-L-arabinofuranosidase C-terminal domain-containing protein [Arcicella rigui]MEA5139925.1 alpha-L-arabinofuranosidase C-terminal domain-containing protein [Arcicella rigui]
MNLKQLTVFSLLATAIGLPARTHAQTPVINIKATQPVAEIKPTMWGIFFEDINMGADGGIYAELVKNRSFEFQKPLMGWKVERKKENEGDIVVQNRQGNTANPRFISVKLSNTSKGDLGLTNEGFKGMGIKKGLRYDFSVLYRHRSGAVKLHLELLDAKGSIIGSTTLTPANSLQEWKKEAISFNATETEAKAKFRIWFEGNGEFDLDMISLFPEDTWKKRPGGMRADMIQLLADMKPGFIRFPGGCIVEGIDLANRYQWKKTLGPIEERQLIINRWNVEFAHRPSPDYFQTFGLGFFEYFQLAEDIGAEPLPILNCGMACQFNTAEVVPVSELEPYIQDALDLIEFANGDVNSKWGKIRAEMGHPAPFNLKMMGVGNENWGPQYVERLKVFTKAIKAKYPNIKLVNSSGTDPEGDRFNYLNTELRSMNADIIDEHYYRTPDWFLKNAARYDTYDRKGSKIFAGEYAAQSDRTVSVNNRNNWKCALSEAAFMTGLERNAEVVQMASYAPLFAHAEGWQWTPDLIWVDNLRSYGTPNYHVQKLYSTNKGTHVLNTTQNGTALTGQDDLFASGILDKATNEVILKVANVSDKAQVREVNLEGIKKFDTKAKLTVLKNDNLDAANTFENATNVSPVEETITLNPKKKISLTLAPNSFTVLRVKLL